MTIAENLKPSSNCIEIYRRANKVLIMISRHIICKSWVLKLYKSLVWPMVEYCMSAWSTQYEKDKNLLERMSSWPLTMRLRHHQSTRWGRCWQLGGQPGNCPVNMRMKFVNLGLRSKTYHRFIRVWMPISGFDLLHVQIVIYGLVVFLLTNWFPCLLRSICC